MYKTILLTLGLCLVASSAFAGHALNTGMINGSSVNTGMINGSSVNTGMINGSSVNTGMINGAIINGLSEGRTGIRTSAVHAVAGRLVVR